MQNKNMTNYTHRQTKSIKFLSAILRSVIQNVCLYALYPIDVLISPSIVYPSILQIDGQFKGFMELFLRLYTAHGIGFLWNGYWADALAYYPHRITEYFVKQVLEDAFVPSSWCDKIADQVGIFVAYPFKLASTRMVFDMTLNDTLKYSSTTDYFAVTLKDGGVSLLFTGYLLDKGVDSLTSALREKADKTIEQLQQNHSFANLWVITAVVYSCIEFVAFPAKLVRYNMQLQAALPKELYAGAIDCCIKIYRAGGFKAFYSGITLSLAVVSLFALLITAVNRSNYSKAKME